MRGEDVDEQEVARGRVGEPGSEREDVARLVRRIEVEAGDDRVGHGPNLGSRDAPNIGEDHGSTTARATDGGAPMQG
jgi:hypothetical protein